MAMLWQSKTSVFFLDALSTILTVLSRDLNTDRDVLAREESKTEEGEQWETKKSKQSMSNEIYYMEYIGKIVKGGRRARNVEYWQRTLQNYAG